MAAPDAQDMIYEALEDTVRMVYGLEDSIDLTDLWWICMQRAAMTKDPKVIKLLESLYRAYTCRKERNADTLRMHKASLVFTQLKTPNISTDQTMVADGAHPLEREWAIFAVVVGINSYAEDLSLKEAEKDVLAFNDFLLHDLQTSANHIKLLRGHMAMRQCIMDTLHMHFHNNSDICPGDAIIFYFMGHGSSHDLHGKGAVECIILIDNAPICEHELHTFLKDLSHVKGKNITLIFDCCFASECTWDGWPTHSGSSGSYSGSQRARFMDSSFTTASQGSSGSGCACCLADDDDWEQDMMTHMLLAACHDYERALESMEGRVFTVALLRHLQSVLRDAITYQQFMDSFPSLSPRQHPILMGEYKNDYLFCLGQHDSKELSSTAGDGVSKSEAHCSVTCRGARSVSWD